MKNKININLPKDTPPETLTEFCAVLKAQNEKPKRKQPLYAFNEDIEKLHERYEQLFKQVKSSLNLSANQIEKECETLSRKYDFELEELSKMREVDYDIKLAEIEQRKRNLKPWRRCWLWRLIFQPLTNRAQDIIEARAELESDIQHTSEEKEIEDERNKNLPTDDKKLSKRKLKREMRAELKKIIKRADKADLNEAFEEPLAKQDETGNAEHKPIVTSTPQGKGQLPGQLTLDDVQTMPTAQARRPRPPRSCRKQ
ncbi:MAG: hypothetical protein K2H30_06325 [Clostridia bacterium]|nr:hypothetical protein [Clostridia bacterium]